MTATTTAPAKRGVDPDRSHTFPIGSMVVEASETRPRLDLNRDVHCLFGLIFDAVDLDQAVRKIRDAAVKHERCFVSTPNVNFAIAAQSDAAFRASVHHSDLSLADGMPIVWAARLLGVPLKTRVAGSDVFERLQSTTIAAEPALKVYFFGGPDGIAERACERLNRQPGGLRCVGFQSPGFGSLADISTDKCIDAINAAEPDFVVVALGAKKGQAWIELNRSKLTAPVISHLGAVVNFVAGSVRRASPAWRTLGLEWLWRIREEPALLRRYASDGWSLAKLICTTVVPGVLARRRSRAVAYAARIERAADTTRVTLQLHGAWVAPVLQVLRSEIAEHLRQGKQVQLDLSRTSAIDSAFLGLVMLLDSWQEGSRALVPGTAVAPLVRGTFRSHGASFLLDSRHDEGA